MTRNKFDRALAQVLKWEVVRDKNGNVVATNDPADPGGVTKYGIDQRSHPHINVRNLTEDAAREIYKTEYWDRVMAEWLPTPIAEVVFDVAVNNGASRAARWLQQELGVKVDGHIGPVTIAATRSLTDPGIIAVKLLRRRESFYRQIAQGKKQKFLRGWLNRNDDFRHFVAHLIVRHE